MAQVTPFEWYKAAAPLAIPGMKADATVDVIDSFTAEAALNPGIPVIRGTADDQCKPVAQSTDVANVIGIAVHTHKSYEGSGAYYEAGYCLPVMTFGDVYVKLAGTVSAGGAAAILIDGDGNPTFVASGTASAENLSGVTYLASGVSGDIVPVRIRK